MDIKKHHIAIGGVIVVGYVAWVIYSNIKNGKAIATLQSQVAGNINDITSLKSTIASQNQQLASLQQVPTAFGTSNVSFANADGKPTAFYDRLLNPSYDDFVENSISPDTRADFGAPFKRGADAISNKVPFVLS